MTIFTQTLLVIFCCIGNCPFHSNLSSWSNLKNRNINRCKTSQHLKSQLQVLEINCGSSWWQEVLPLHLTTTHSVRYTRSVVSHALPRNTTSRVGFSPRLFVFVRGSSLSATCLYPLSLFLLTLSSLPHISIVKRTLVNQMWHFQCSLLLVTKDGNNATRNTKTGKQKVWERGLSECQSEVPKTAESNKETFDLPPLSLPSRPNSWPQVFGDSDPTRPNVYEASSDQSGVTTPHHHQYSRLCSPFILKYISPNTCCAGHSINNRLTFTKHFSCTLYIGKELSIYFLGQSFSKSYQEHLRMFKYVRLGPGAVYIHTIIHPGQEVVTGWKLWKLSWVRAQ